MLTQDSTTDIETLKSVNSSYKAYNPVPVWLLVSMFDDGMTAAQIVQQFPSISAAEIKAAAKYAGSTAVVTD